MEENKEYLKITEFNAAKAYEYRLMYWLSECEECMRDEDYKGWFYACVNVYKIINCKLTESNDKDKESNDKDKESEKDKLKKELEGVEKSYKSFLSKKNNNIFKKTFFSDLPSKLRKFELLLRDYANKHGMLNPDKKGMFDEEEEF